MNEHIKKLLDKALDQAVPETWTQLSHEQMTRLSSVFAELIVMECIKILADNGEFRGCVIIGKHFRVFGVEE